MTSTPAYSPQTKPGFGWSLIRTASGLAVNSIRVHKLRSALTLLGVIIGVASVVLVGSAIEGMGAYADTNVSRVFGANSFVIQRVAVENGANLGAAEREAKVAGGAFMHGVDGQTTGLGAGSGENFGL